MKTYLSFKNVVVVVVVAEKATTENETKLKDK
jgi:hypothetical protein